MWWFPVVALAAAPEPFFEVPAPGPPPYAFGPYWHCSLATAEPVCNRVSNTSPRGVWTVHPFTHPVPAEAGPLAQLVGFFQGPTSVALGADGRVWFPLAQGYEVGSEAYAGTLRVDGNGGILCGASASEGWCSTGALKSAERVKFVSGAISEVTVDGDAAAIRAKDGRVGLVWYPITGTKPFAESFAWSSALKGTTSLAVVSAADLACGLSATGSVVCASLAAPSVALTFGSEAVGAKSFWQDDQKVPVDGVRFVALRTLGVAMMALADDGRVFVFRPPDDGGTVYAVDGVALHGNGCVERKAGGPWWCIP